MILIKNSKWSNLAPKRGLNLYKFYKDCKIFGLENAVIGLISPLYFSKFARIVCPQLLWAMLDVPLSRVRTLTQPCLQRLFSPNTSGSYHAPSQMAMTCSGMMSYKRINQNFTPVVKYSHHVASCYAFCLSVIYVY